MWIVHAGNRVDTPDRATARFPVTKVPAVEARLRRLLAELRPSGVVSAAAAGADLLVLGAAADLGIEIDVLLPLEVDDFVKRSVADQGDDWVERFERLLPDRAQATVADLSAYDDWYLRGNDLLLDRVAARSEKAGEGVIVVTVRPAPGGPPSATDDLAAKAAARGWPIIDIDPTDDRPWPGRW